MTNSYCQCWNCSYSHKSFRFFCKQCNIIQKPVELDAFKIFGLKYKFLINEDKLEAQYYALLSQLHPDKFINKTEKEKLYSQIHSSNLNVSYNILVNIISRANELLKYFGMDINANESFNDKNILNEIMELQDEKENLKTSLEYVNFKKKIENYLEFLIKNLNQMFCNKNIIEANKVKIKISYLNKIINNI